MVHHFAIGIIGICPSSTKSGGCPTTARDSSARCVGSSIAIGKAVIDFRSYFFGRFDRASPAHVTQPPMEALVRGRYVV